MICSQQLFKFYKKMAETIYNLFIEINKVSLYERSREENKNTGQ